MHKEGSKRAEELHAKFMQMLHYLRWLKSKTEEKRKWYLSNIVVKTQKILQVAWISTY